MVPSERNIEYDWEPGLGRVLGESGVFYLGDHGDRGAVARGVLSQTASDHTDPDHPPKAATQLQHYTTPG
jgi:hypothetical protein